MPRKYIPLNFLPIGKKATIRKLICDGAVRRRMLDLGLIFGTVVEALMSSPAGDPVAYDIRGAVIALRGTDARTVWVDADDERPVSPVCIEDV